MNFLDNNNNNIISKGETKEVEFEIDIVTRRNQFSLLVMWTLLGFSLLSYWKEGLHMDDTTGNIQSKM
jgi:hypothetical protein